MQSLGNRPDAERITMLSADPGFVQKRGEIGMAQSGFEQLVELLAVSIEDRLNPGLIGQTGRGVKVDLRKKILVTRAQPLKEVAHADPRSSAAARSWAASLAPRCVCTASGLERSRRASFISWLSEEWMERGTR